MAIALMILSIIASIPDLIKVFNLIMSLIDQLRNAKDRDATRRKLRRTLLKHATFHVLNREQAAHVHDEAGLRAALESMRQELEAKHAAQAKT